MRKSENKPAGPQPLPLLLMIIGLLLIAGAVVWQVARPGQSQVAAPQPTITNDPNVPYPEVPRVTLEDAKTAHDEQAAVFLDVRSKESYAEAHIPGAINIPVAELESRANELNPNDWIITYCT